MIAHDKLRQGMQVRIMDAIGDMPLWIGDMDEYVGCIGTLPFLPATDSANVFVQFPDGAGFYFRPEWIMSVSVEDLENGDALQRLRG